jgi:SAM-dependent methyltransferase
MFRKITAVEERQFEERHIMALKERYLATDVINRLRTDPGYREKLNKIETALSGTTGWILDVGANTCGESEYLTTLGYSIIASDINPIALGLSKERCAKFNRRPPHYLGCDGHRLPLEAQSVDFAIFYEALHHMEDPVRTMREVARVLAPGGKVFLYEPCALNPYRRLSEIRDRFKGSIERSFTVNRLRNLLEAVGLEPSSIQRYTYPPSEWKMQSMSSLHRVLRRTHAWFARAIPHIFGDVMALGQKPNSPTRRQAETFESILRCSVTGLLLLKVVGEGGYLSLDEGFRGLYPIRQGIPLLIREEARRLDKETWRAYLHSAFPLRVARASLGVRQE